MLGGSVEELAFFPCEVGVGGSEVIARLLDWAAARCSEWDEGLALEIVGFDEGVDDGWSCVPPYWETNVDGCVVVHVVEFAGKQPSPCHLTSSFQILF